MVARSAVDVVNREANFASPLEWPMTEGPEKPADAELEALGESGFALAIQLLGRHEDAIESCTTPLKPGSWRKSSDASWTRCQRNNAK